jgi:hypothetical protein
MNLKNKSSVLFLLLAGILAVGSAAYSGKFKFNDRWNNRFVTDSPTGEAAKNNTTNLSTGKTVKEDGSTVPASNSTADTQAFGTGDINCRDSVLKLKRTDDPANSEVSELTVHEIKDSASQVFACTSALPKMAIKGQPVDKGSMTLKCNNGQLRIIASTCDSTPPPPSSSTAPATDPAAGGGGGGSTPPPANANGCPAGYGVQACGSCCSDGTATQYFACGKENRCGKYDACFCGKTTYRSCQNGKKYDISTGKCAK